MVNEILKYTSIHIRFLLAFIFLIARINAQQTYAIKGKIIDGMDNSSIPGVTIRLIDNSNITQLVGTTSDDKGNFQFTSISPGNYKLSISFISYVTFEQAITLSTTDLIIPIIKLEPDVKQLKEVKVESQQVRAEQKGDTTQFNANAYKTNPDATVEDLIKKMPGVTSDGTTVKVNGEEVKKVLVDGKPFFGDDPSTTLKNFPADMIDKIQIFDKSSDQAQFTGFKDGDEQKTINIVTKADKKVGQFGKLYAGYGTDDRYNAGLTYNYFNGNRRISVLGMSNNINQQNFNISDIMSTMSSSSSQGRGGSGRMNGGSQGGGQGSTQNFLTGQQNGITNTNALGFNYSDNWGKKINVSGSYFFNQTSNINTSSIVRNYFTKDKLIYNQTSVSNTENLNHKVNFKFEYSIDSANSLIITPRLTFQKYNNNTELNSNNKLPESNTFISKTLNTSKSNNKGYNFQNDVLYQHKFRKRGRTISLNINTQLNDKTGNGTYYSSSIYTDTSTTQSILDQDYITTTDGNTLGGNLSYTEPVGKQGQMIVAYRPTQSFTQTDKTTYNIDSLGIPDNLDISLSNKYNTTYATQQGGVSYRMNSPKLNFRIGVDIQEAKLKSQQTYPLNSIINRSFTSILPTAMINYKFSKTKNINATYRTQTKSPSISQLQNVLDVSNPLLVKSGNINLKQTFDNTLNVRLGLTSTEKSKNFFVFFNATQTMNYISNATYILSNDTVLQGYTINKGSQLTIPVNLPNYYALRAFGVYSFPVSKIKSNFNVNGGYAYAQTPALINNQLNYSHNQSINGGINLSSNVSQYLDFSLAYNGSYAIVKNTLQEQSNSSYYNHTASFRVNYIMLKKVVLNSDINQITYQGLSQSFNQNYTLWNAYIGYKFFKNQSLEAKVSVYDLLNQNKSVSRTITETYTEDSNTQVLKRYFMFTLTYTFRKFKSGDVPKNTEKNIFPRDMPPPGMMPPPPNSGG